MNDEFRIQKANKNANGFLAKGVFLFFMLIFFSLLVREFAYGLADFNFRGKYFGIELFKNFNFAFSLPLPNIFAYIIYGVILSFIGVYLFKNFLSLPRNQQIAWIFILAGALSNIVERLFFGFVTDYIYIFSGIFNFADFYIILGVLQLFFVNEREGK